MMMKSLGKRKRQYEWKAGEDVFEVSYTNNADCETNIFTVPLSKMNPVLKHVYKQSGVKKFMFDLGQEDALDLGVLFENLNKKQFETLTADTHEDEDGEEEEEEKEEEEDNDDDEEEVEDKEEVVDYIRDWIFSLPDNFSEPAGVPVNILCKFGICESA